MWKRKTTERPYNAWTMSEAELRSYIMSWLRDKILKVCLKCWLEKLLFHFRKRTDNWKYRNECKDCLSKIWKEYKRKNLDKIKIKNANYKKTERWRLSSVAYRWKRRIKIKESSDWSVTKESIKLLLESQWWKCKNCNSDRKLHLDHIYPLSKWWTHTINNVQWLCQTCNLTKWAKCDERKQ